MKKKAMLAVLAKGAHVRIDWQYEELDLIAADGKTLVMLTEKEQDLLSEAVWNLPALASPTPNPQTGEVK